MSLLSINRLRLSIAPNSVALLQVGGLWSPAVQKQAALACEANLPSQIQALHDLLKPIAARQSVDIVLSNHFLRYRLITPPAQGIAANELQALMRASYLEAYGESANGWLLRHQPWLGDGNILAAAMDAELLEQLQALCSQHKLRLRSLQPNLMAGFNRAARQIEKQNACFIQLESGRMLLALLQNQQWHTLRSFQLAADTQHEQWLQQLRTHINRELLLAGWDAADTAIYLDAPQNMPISRLAEGQQWQVASVMPKAISGYSPLDGKFHMAMQGAS